MADRHKPGYIDEYHRANYHQFYMRVRKDSGLFEALTLMNTTTGQSLNSYITEAVAQRLKADGYLCMVANTGKR